MNKEKEVEAYLKGVLPEEQKLKYEIAKRYVKHKKIQKSIVWKLLRTVLFWYTDSSRY